MATDTAHDTAETRQLRTELGRLRQMLHQRDQALTALNRRLLILERDQPASSEPGLRAEVASLLAQNQALVEAHNALDQELSRLRATKLFRFAQPARKIYGRLRRG